MQDLIRRLSMVPLVWAAVTKGGCGITEVAVPIKSLEYI